MEANFKPESSTGSIKSEGYVHYLLQILRRLREAIRQNELNFYRETLHVQHDNASTQSS